MNRVLKSDKEYIEEVSNKNRNKVPKSKILMAGSINEVKVFIIWY